MKKEKMSLEKMKSVLSKTLSRDEMKQVMAGSGDNYVCGGCYETGEGGGPQSCISEHDICEGCGRLC